MTAPDRSVPPPPSSVRAFDFPRVRALELGNGLALRVAELPRLPLVSAVLVLASSESSLEGGRAGLAVLTAEALDGGTRAHAAAELAEAFESIGVSLHANAGWDATTVAFTCVAERLPRALELLAEVARESTFPATEVARARELQLARIRQRAKDPSSLASDWAARLFYADGVPYGRPLAGTPESLAGLGYEEVRSFADAGYRPGGGGLIVVGDVDLSDVAGQAEARFGGWTGRPPPGASFEAPARFGERSLHVVHRPGAVQSELRIGYPGLPRRHEDYFPLVVANTVLGGAFTSRLNLSLRERHGFTYGVRSRFAFRRGPGPFSVSTSVGSEVTAPAVAETISELEKFSRDGPTSAEVEGARDYIAGIFPLRMETTAQIAGRLAEVLVYDLPADHHERYRERIRAVTPDLAREAAARHVRPGEMTVVVVGDADAVGAPLEALGLGPLRVHEPAEEGS